MGGENLDVYSSTYHATLRKGEARGALAATYRLLLLQGERRFGPAPAGAAPALVAVTDQTRLERMAVRILDAAGWDDLLATP